MPALVPGEVFRGLQQLPAHALALELRQDVQGELGQVEVVRERQGDVHGPDDLAVDLGHEDDLALVGVGQLEQLFQRRVGEVVAPPGLHPDLAPHFDGGQEVGGVGPVEGIRDPQLLNPHVICHRGHHPSRSAATHGRQSTGIAGLCSPRGQYPARPAIHAGLARRSLPLAVVAGRPEPQGDVDGEHVVVFGGVEGDDPLDRGMTPPAAAEG